MNGGQRFGVIDALRGFAIMLMLFQHSFLYIIENPEKSDIYIWAIIVSRLSFPLFLMISGYCVGLSAERRIVRDGRRGYLVHSFKRLAYLLALGALVNALRLDPVWSINVLHIIGFSVFFASLITLSGSRHTTAITLTVLLAYSCTNPVHNSNVRFDGLWGLLIAFATTGEYPLASWLVYAIVGLGIRQARGKPTVIIENQTLTGLSLILLSLATIYLGIGFNMSSNPLPFILLICGISYIAYDAIAHLNAHVQAAGEFLSAFGRHALSIYVVHQFLYITVPKVFGFANRLGEIYGAVVLVGFISVAYATIRKLERR